MSESWHNSHIVANGEVGSCWHCELPTRFVDLAFEARLHPGLCTDVKWDEYFQALRLSGVRQYVREHPGQLFTAADVQRWLQEEERVGF